MHDDASIRLRIVMGKGGIGKTTVTAAWALAEAAKGRKVLAAEIQGEGALARLLGAPNESGEIHQVAPNLWTLDLTPEASLHEYALTFLRFEALYRTVFENRMMKRFLRLIPSLGELVMLGKLWYRLHSDPDDMHARQHFDVAVIDAPATGHGIAMLRTPQAVGATVPAGPLRSRTDAAALPSRSPHHCAAYRYHPRRYARDRGTGGGPGRPGVGAAARSLGSE